MMNSVESNNTPLKIGWASCDITPRAFPVLIAGQFHARVSEGVDDPLSATALALESGEDQVIFVSCDLVGISQELQDAVRSRLREGRRGEPVPEKVILNATHTHTGPEIRLRTSKGDVASKKGCGVELDTASPARYVEYLADQVVACIRTAWNNRKPGRIAFGLDYAVVGRNRRWVDREGRATMYELEGKEARERFRQIEGYEDHSVNLLATYDDTGSLTGILINLPCPSQESEHNFRLSADFWCEARQEIRSKLGDGIFILPQCSAAGDQTSHLIFENEAYERMLRLRDRSTRSEVAGRIADAVARILPSISGTAVSAAELVHSVSHVELPSNRIGRRQAEEACQQAQQWKVIYEKEVARLENDPALRDQPRWYVAVTTAFRRMNWYEAVTGDYERQQRNEGLTYGAEVHVVRLGEIAFASTPFEYYLDFGIQIKVRSPFIQTFLIQLAGRGTYVPTPRSVSGGGYGAIAASNPVGPEGGQALAEYTVAALRRLCSESK